MLNFHYPKYLIIGCLLFIGGFRFINLGAFNLQEWDEALYAVRAKSVVYFNDWLDQTPHSVNGLYSSTHPPLYVWLTAISYSIFGINEFSSRLISALSGTGLIILIYLIGSLIFNRETGFISACFLGLNSFFSFWTRQGQFDTLLTFFIVLAFYFYIKSRKIDIFSHKKKSNHQKDLFLLLCSVSIGLGLMTKLFVASICFIIIFFYELFIERNYSVKNFILFVAPALVISLPWYLMMTIKYGQGNMLFLFNDAQMIERTFSGIEGNTKELGLLYYINQLMIIVPYILIFFIYSCFKIYKENAVLKSLMIWILAYFIIISIIATKLVVYLLPILIPITLIASASFLKFINNKIRNRELFIMFTLTNILLIWSLNGNFRSEIKKLFSGHFFSSLTGILNEFYWIFILFILIQFLIIFFYKYKLFYRFSKSIIYFCIILPLFFTTLLHFLIYDKMNYNDGIKEVSKIITANLPSNIISIGNGSNPQITYYLDGIDIGWKKNINFIRLEPKSGLNEIRNKLTSFPERNSIVIVEKEEMALGYFSNYEQVIPDKYNKIFESKSYALFCNK